MSKLYIDEIAGNKGLQRYGGLIMAKQRVQKCINSNFIETMEKQKADTKITGNELTVMP